MNIDEPETIHDSSSTHSSFLSLLNLIFFQSGLSCWLTCGSCGKNVLVPRGRWRHTEVISLEESLSKLLQNSIQVYSSKDRVRQAPITLMPLKAQVEIYNFLALYQGENPLVPFPFTDEAYRPGEKLSLHKKHSKSWESFKFGLKNGFCAFTGRVIICQLNADLLWFW